MRIKIHANTLFALLVIFSKSKKSDLYKKTFLWKLRPKTDLSSRASERCLVQGDSLSPNLKVICQGKDLYHYSFNTIHFSKQNVATFSCLGNHGVLAPETGSTRCNRLHFLEPFICLRSYSLHEACGKAPFLTADSTSRIRQALKSAVNGCQTKPSDEVKV